MKQDYISFLIIIIELKKYIIENKIVYIALIYGGTKDGKKTNRAFKNIGLSSKNRAGDPFENIR
jgi:hypothetical protein